MELKKMGVKNLIRIGSRSKEAQLEAHNLENMKRQQQTNAEGRAFGKIFAEIKKLEADITNLKVTTLYSIEQYNLFLIFPILKNLVLD